MSKNTTYTVSIVREGVTYDVSPLLISISTSDDETLMAQSYTLTLYNKKIGDKWAAGLFGARQRVFVYADDGLEKKEVFRGWIWRRGYVSSNSNREFKLICYDNLIYFQESEVYYYFQPGMDTKEILTKICWQWGVNLSYNYETIKHDKIVIKGTLANVIRNELLNPVRDRCGKKYVLKMDGDTLNVDAVGENQTIYQIVAGKNATRTSSEQTMDGMVTRVVVFGKQMEGDRAPIEFSIAKNTDKYGTIQKVYGRTEGMSWDDAKKDAEKILSMGKSPFWNYEIEAPDIPWIRKGDVIFINAGDIYMQHLIIKSISRTISNSNGAIMSIKADNGLPREYKTPALSSSIIKAPIKNATSTGDLFSSDAKNEIIIWNFCRAQGFSAAATAGIMGNMEAESGLNPDQWEVATGWYGKGYGLCQWTNTGGGTAARLDRLINWCKEQGYSHKTLEGQLNFMMYEYKNVAYYWNNLGTSFMKSTDVWTATDRFLTYFEGCTVSRSDPVVQWNRRINSANNYYKKYSQYNQIPIPGKNDDTSNNKDSSSSSGSSGSSGMTAKQRAVVNAAYSTGPSGVNACAAWVCAVFQNSGILVPQRFAWASHYNRYCFSSNEADLKPGMICVTPTTPYGGPSIYPCGHICIYVGNGVFMHDELGVVRKDSLSRMRSTYYSSPWYWGWMNGVDLSR